MLTLPAKWLDLPRGLMDGYFQHLGTENGESFKAFWRVGLVIHTSTLVLCDGATGTK